MTPNELIVKLTTMLGQCGRFCAYCPDDINTAEAKECVEKMQKEIYTMQECCDDMMKEIIKIRAAYRRDTGHEYKENADGDTNT